MAPSEYQYLFGPVPSRRLGKSLGVDLVPFKVCSFDCLYCQLGCTTVKTTERKEWVPTGQVISEIERWTRDGHTADAIALAGSGEPTLHSRFGEVLHFIRKAISARSVLLSNGSLFHLDEVRESAALADIVKVTLSAWDEASWERIHRHATGIRFQDMLEGFRDFRHQYPGELWIEVFVMQGINSEDAEIRKIARLANELNPQRIQLNTAVRPPTDPSVLPVNMSQMERIARLFGPTSEVIGAYEGKGSEIVSGVSERELLAIIQRHPCSLADLSAAAGVAEQKLRPIMDSLVAAGRARQIGFGASTAYIAVRPGDAEKETAG